MILTLARVTVAILTEFLELLIKGSLVPSIPRLKLTGSLKVESKKLMQVATNLENSAVLKEECRMSLQTLPNFLGQKSNFEGNL